MVAALTILTAAAAYAGVSTLVDAESHAFIGAREQTCPATGCTAADCHATSGKAGAFAEGSTADSWPAAPH